MVELVDREKVQHQTQSDITIGHEHEIDFGADWEGTLTVEYKPWRWKLSESASERIAERDFWYSTENNENITEPPVEQIIEKLYRALIEVLYPKQVRMDDPSEYVSLVVSVDYGKIEYGKKSEWNYYCSIGSYA